MRIDKSYTLNMSGGSNLISESFGLRDGYEVKICDIDFPEKYDVLLITGESGSGKTTIAKEVFGSLSTKVPDAPLYTLNGNSTESQSECLRVLGICGITDAVQFVSLPSQLSDSQRERVKIAYQIMSGKDCIVVDEFLSTLDRETAKAVAFCIQKAIRKTGKKLVAITAHDDIEEYLMPDYTIRGKSYPSKFTVSKNEYNLSKNPFTDCVSLRYGNKMDYKNCDLGLLHYKGKYTGGTKEYLFAYMGEKVVGVLVSTYNRSTGGRRISRVVVHPTYRGLGVGRMIVKKYTDDYKDCDVIATMAMFNPVFEKAGMKRISDSIVKSPKGLKKSLQEIGFDLSKWHDKDYCTKFCDDGGKREVISEYAKYATDLVCPGGNYMGQEEIKEKIYSDSKTAGRVLFQLREKRYAKYIVEED